ncbi:hypothetical protein QBC43DRAFT_373518 [Cladorrhinum sp. PSN259]|nr:hypothetical protein QBC43DRAFT_373518 [Cladorrhinum sp. PSN259]
MSRSPILKHSEWESIDIGIDNTTPFTPPTPTREITYRHVQPFIPIHSYNESSTQGTTLLEDDDISSLFPLPPTYSHFDSTPYTPRSSRFTPINPPSTHYKLNSPEYPSVRTPTHPQFNTSTYSPRRTTTTTYSTFPPFSQAARVQRHDNVTPLVTKRDESQEGAEVEGEDDCYSDHMDLDDYLDDTDLYSSPSNPALKADKPALQHFFFPSHKSKYISALLAAFESDKSELDRTQKQPLLPLHHRHKRTTTATTADWKGVIGPGLKVMVDETETETEDPNTWIEGGSRVQRGWQKTMISILLWVMFLLCFLGFLGYLVWMAVVAAAAESGSSGMEMMTNGEKALCSEAKPRFCHLVLGANH